jgi:tetratricopeptide (TPR) repeat protein
MSAMHVFVSHSHQDDAFCRELVEALRKTGANVWYDEHNMGSGQLGPTIERELRARPVFVLILSPAAVSSNWVEDESRWAYGLYRKDRSRTILPVLADPVNEDDIWLFLQDFKRIEEPGVKPYARGEAIQRTLHALGLAGSTAPERGETAEELVTRGKALNSQKKHAEALPLFQRATQLDPSSLDAWYDLGYTFVCIGEHLQEALTAFEKALTLDPNILMAWNNKAFALLRLGRNQEALDATERAIALDPNDALAWVNKAGALVSLKRYQEALAAAEKATTLDPNDAAAWGNKGAALTGFKRYEEALTALDRALALQPSSLAWEWKAAALRGLGREREAQEADAKAKALG